MLFQTVHTTVRTALQLDGLRAEPRAGRLLLGLRAYLHSGWRADRQVQLRQGQHRLLVRRQRVAYRSRTVVGQLTAVHHRAALPDGLGLRRHCAGHQQDHLAVVASQREG